MHSRCAKIKPCTATAQPRVKWVQKLKRVVAVPQSYLKQMRQLLHVKRVVKFLRVRQKLLPHFMMQRQRHLHDHIRQPDDLRRERQPSVFPMLVQYRTINSVQSFGSR